MAKQTAKPKKLKVERDGQKFKCQWTCGETYDQSVKFYYTLYKSKKLSAKPGKSNAYVSGNPKSLAKKANHKTVEVKFSDYYPYKYTSGSKKGKKKPYLKGFAFTVQGDKKEYKKKGKTIDPKPSDYVTSDVFDIKVPPKMALGNPSYAGAYYSTFSYTIPSDHKNQPVIDIEWQGYLGKDGESPNWKKPDKTGVRKKSQGTSFNIYEDKYKGEDIQWNVPGYSYTRYVRIRARGPAGPGPWSTVKKHVYAPPYMAYDVDATLSKVKGQAGYLCKIRWKAGDDKKRRPNDATIVEYKFAVPTEGMGCPDPDEGWEEIPSGPMKDTPGYDRYSFVLPAFAQKDHALFVRVNTVHDDKTTYGYPTYVKQSAAKLISPVLGSATPDADTKKISLTGISNNSAHPGSVVAIYYKDAKGSKPEIVGYTDQTYTTVQLPEWGENGFSIGVRAIAGATFKKSSTSKNESVKEVKNVGSVIDSSAIGPWFGTTLGYSPVAKTTITIRLNFFDKENTSKGYANCKFVGGTAKTVTVKSPDVLCTMSVKYDGAKTIETRVTEHSSLYTGGQVSIYSAAYTKTTVIENAVSYYSIEKNNSTIGIMQSDIEWGEGDIPMPPTNLNVAQDGVNTILATWDWNWKQANTAEISWSTHEDAWESTDEPQTYTIDGVRASRWKIANLEPGNWYVRVRLIKTSDESSVYGTYANATPFPLKVSSAPTRPTLTLLPDTITVDGSTTASWAYEAADGTTQAEGELYEVTDDGNGGYTYAPLNPPAKVTSAQFITIRAAEQGWKEGETHRLALRLTSTADELSEDYSPPQTVTVVTKPVAIIEETNLQEKTRVIDSGTDDEPQVTETIPNVLVDLPLTVNVTGAGEGGRSYLTILRDGPYHGERPDGTNYDGFDEEVIASLSEPGDGSFIIEKTDRSGYFDDGGSYKMVAMVRDSRGQVSKTTEIFRKYEPSTDTEVDTEQHYYSYDEETETYTEVDPQEGDNPHDKGWYILHVYTNFIVLWDHQAVMPDADIQVLEDEEVVFITPKLPEVLPEGWKFDKGDTCDIYRLSADKPELIITGGKFGTKYVDPYPTYGEFGGHRLVYVTKNGDYTIEETEAINDFTEDDGDILSTSILKNFKTVIDFSNERLELPYDISVSHKWGKDVTFTKYLDGSVTADWNQAYDMTSTVNSTVWIEEDPEKIRALRRLATWPGYCHIRTPDGSSFTADVQVNLDYEERWITELAKVSLSITRVDNYRLDGMTYYDWIEQQEQE